VKKNWRKFDASEESFSTLVKGCGLIIVFQSTFLTTAIPSIKPCTTSKANTTIRIILRITSFAVCLDKAFFARSIYD
jgi:hypothetical protein